MNFLKQIKIKIQHHQRMSKLSKQMKSTKKLYAKNEQSIKELKQLINKDTQQNQNP